MYIEKHILVKNVNKWVRLFKESQNIIQDEHKPGRSTMTSTPEMVDLANAFIQAARRVTIADIS